MKRHSLAPLATIFMTIAIVGVVAIGLSDGKAKTIKEGGILSINDIMADPGAYEGTITITGVVAGFSKQNPKVFTLIETSEAKLCKSTGCAKFYLPVRYEGKLPEAWDEVNATGNLVEGKLLFLATKVDVLRHLRF